MNGSSKGTSGVVDLGTVITAHQDISGKQDTLVSGTNIKTINNTSLLGSGNISISSGTATDVQINGTSIVSSNTANIRTNGTYNASTNKLATMSDLPTVPTNVSAFTNDAGYTTNTGTITGITMNGASKGTSGVVNLGTVITSHQDISGKENTTNKVTSLSSSSTDTQYPSAKCVYDLIGDIETLLQGV